MHGQFEFASRTAEGFVPLQKVHEGQSGGGQLRLTEVWPKSKVGEGLEMSEGSGLPR